MIRTHNVRSNVVINDYYDLLVDKNRNKFFYDALAESAKDKVVLDLGTGTGILAHYALTAGAKFVYAVDNRLDMTLMSNKILRNSFDSSRFKVINDNFWNESFYQKFDKDIDLVVTETVGRGLFDEGMINTWSSINKYLKKDLNCIPDRLSIDLWMYDNANEVSFYDPAPESNLTEDDLIDKAFFDSLVTIDNLLNKQIKSTNNLISKWAIAKQKPNIVKENVFSYSSSNLPNIMENLKLDISTEVQFEFPCVVVLVNKLEFKNKILFLPDAKKQAWRYSPCFIVNKPGKYKLVYKNHKLEKIPEIEWELTFLD